MVLMKCEGSTSPSFVRTCSCWNWRCRRILLHSSCCIDLIKLKKKTVKKHVNDHDGWEDRKRCGNCEENHPILSRV